MSETLINRSVRVMAGAIGNPWARRSIKECDLGMLGNTIAGTIGGGVTGQILRAVDTRAR